MKPSAQMGGNSLIGLDPRLGAQVNKAKAAFEEGNTEYVVLVCSQIIANHPECVDVRRLLRQAQLRQEGKRGKRVWRWSPIYILFFKHLYINWIRINPKALFKKAETLLSRDPGNLSALEMLGVAAEQLGWWETAIFAYELLREKMPQKITYLRKLGHAYWKKDRWEASIAIGEQILKSHPGDPAAQHLIKQASVERSLRSVRWEENGD